ncbi:unnamed protein product [Brugia pahangi]|uniref:Uncharacterized protein n=1 Tax=Brugia pahangi TaxID=6280 RepID=A0A0N4TTH6_BRUPA|nr:unnamed protein product [Brugia pahangi]
MQSNCSSVLQQEIQEIPINSLLAKLNSIEEQLINKYVVSGKISYEDETRYESRRIKRQSEKGNKLVNNYFREHLDLVRSGICFKCSSTEHTSSRYHRKNVRGMFRYFMTVSFYFFVYISIYYFSGGSCNLYVVKQVWCYIKIIETT